MVCKSVQTLDSLKITEFRSWKESCSDLLTDLSPREGNLLEATPRWLGSFHPIVGMKGKVSGVRQTEGEPIWATLSYAVCPWAGDYPL